MDFLVTPEWLDSRLKKEPEQTVLVDCRFQLTDPAAGKQAYLEGHIPTAVYLDLNKDLSDIKQEHGGSHPLPREEEFVKLLGKIGIESNTSVIVYDQASDMFSARCWWLLRHYGHEKVYILDGGLSSWLEHGYPVSRDIPEPTEKQFTPRMREDETVGMEEVKQKVEQRHSTLIDSREWERYVGETEPLYTKAGHIPGARNCFWKEVVNENGKWKSPEELRKQFAGFSPEEEMIVSCGSGVSACVNIAALKAAGFQNVKLYPGSFSDWISYPENPVATGKE